MKELTAKNAHDLSAVLGQLRALAINGFNAGLEACYLSIARESQQARTSSQNSLLWPLLNDFSKQVEHYGQKYSSEQWKDLLTSSFEGVTQYAPNLEGTGFVAFGARTSKYSKKKMSEFIEFIYAEGSQRGVKWSDKSEQSVSEVRG